MRHATFPTRPTDRGFSFIELLAYMAIAALLVLAAIPQFSAYRERALISNLQGDVRNASLSAEASLIAKRSGATVKLASTAVTAADSVPTPGSFEAIAAAVAATKVSDSRSTLASYDLGGGDYEIRGTNPKTDRMAVFASKADTARGFDQGLSLVDASRNDDGASPPATTTPESPTAWCKAGVPTSTIKAFGTLRGSVTKYQDAFRVNLGQVSGTPVFPYPAKGEVQPTDIRVWSGSKALCDATWNSWVRAPEGGIVGAFGLQYTGAADFQRDVTTNMDPLTIQFTYGGKTHVLLIEGSNEGLGWFYGDEPEPM